MNEPLRPARIDFSDASAPRCIDFDDVYHAPGNAYVHAHHVFLAGNGLPQRWAARDHFVILEAGFGLGHNFLATWAAWRDDAARCGHLWFLSVDKHPPQRADLQRTHAHGAEPALAHALVSAWPPLTPDLHRRDFAEGHVHLLLAFGDFGAWLSQWVAQVDAFYLDGFAPAKNAAMWEPRMLQRLGRLAAPGATVATWCSAHGVREGLVAAGFHVQHDVDLDGKRDRVRARHAPHHRAPQPAGRRHGGGRDVAIVGAGLAGAAVARALSQLGMTCTVFDAQADVASGGSGQSAGLMHGVVHADDSPHTRWFRAGALRAHAAIAPLIASQHVRGQLRGLLRLERTLDLDAMRHMLDARGLPADYVQALSCDEATALAACRLAGVAWFYPGGGWVDPRDAVRAWLAQPQVTLRLRTAITHVTQRSDGRWRLIGDAALELGTADHVVLANAGGTQALVPGADWPLHSSRGQVTMLAHELPGWRPTLPIAGDGYAIPLPDGGLLCGATSDLDDLDGTVRVADHQRNLETLQRLSGRTMPHDLAALEGRVAWRVHTRDRLPLLGGVPLLPDERRGHTRQDQPRFIARHAGLHVCAALGSRGLTQATLAGEVIAAMITDTPLPIGSSLLDAVDAARFAARAARPA